MPEDKKNEEVKVPEQIKKSGLSKLFVKLHKKLTAEYEGNKEFLVRFITEKYKASEKTLAEGYLELKKSNDAWIELTDKNLAAFKQKYEGLYTVLTRSFLVDLEGRVNSSEIFVQATLDLMLEKFYRAETGSPPMGDHFKEWREDVAKRHGELSANIHKELTDLKAKESIEDVRSTKNPDSEAKGADSGANQTSVESSDGSVRAEDQNDVGRTEQKA